MATVGFQMNFNSRVRGPISSGAIHRHVRDYESDVAKAIADEGLDMVKKSLNSTLRHQTPHLMKGVGNKRLAWNRWELHSHRHIPYDHWIEGTGSRNSPVTRFPGYHNFALTEVALKGKRGAISNRILRRHRARGRLI